MLEGTADTLPQKLKGIYRGPLGEVPLCVYVRVHYGYNKWAPI